MASTEAAPAPKLPAIIPLKPATEGRAERLRVDEQRKGIRTPWVPVNLQWRFEDIDAIWEGAEVGLFQRLHQMVEAFRYGGGVAAGLMATRTSMVRLPVQFHGDPFLCSQLRGEPPKYDPQGRLISKGNRGLFKQMFPTPALIDLLYTGILAGVAVAEMVEDPVTGIRVMHTRDLYYLRYDWSERCWKYKPGQGQEVIVEPGNGRWILFMPYSTHRPWRSGLWLPLSLAFVVLLSSVYDAGRYQAKHSDPLKYIEVPNDVPEDDVDRFAEFVDYWWERSPGIVLRYGAKAGVVETGGEGYQIYRQQQEWAERQINFAITGNTVVGTGRGGISDGGDLWRDITDSVIAGTAEALSECITEQGLVPWSRDYWGMSRELAPTASWDVRSPSRKAAEAKALAELAESVDALDVTYGKRGRRVNIDAFMEQNGISVPTEELQAQPPPLPGSEPIDALPKDTSEPTPGEIAEGLMLPASTETETSPVV
jgi:hypothetical protein